MKIDLIIPVYDALADLKTCVESLQRWLDFSLVRVLLVNDCSPDPAVLPYLEELADGEHFVLIQAKQNGGFSNSVNLGIQYDPARDVILLNSDTVVTARFAEKMQQCAYLSERIGTVTPLSNNGAICSVPNFMQSNELPEGFTIDSYAELIEKCSLHQYPQLPMAVGFCMYIKRSAILEIGLFDGETFGRGYGEENDYCFRMEQLGYCHLLCDDTFIYHKGEASFALSGYAEERKKANEMYLFQTYRRQVVAADEFIKADSLRWLRENIRFAQHCNNGKKNVLEYLHLGFEKGVYNNIGGTQFHVQDIVEGSEAACNYFVVARDQKNLTMTVYLDQDVFSFAWPLAPLPETPVFSEPSFASAIGFILDHFDIGLVHVHHTFTHTFDIFYEAKKRGIPLFLTLHDYYYLCPNFQLLNAEGNCCIGRRTAQMCADCLNAKYGYTAPVLQTWQHRCSEVLGDCTQIFTPSENAKSVYTAVYPALADKIAVAPHGIDLAERVTRKGKTEPGQLHVAFLGNMAPFKGSRTAYEMITQNTDPALHWSIFGISNDEQLSALNRADLQQHGGYQRTEITHLLQSAGVDVIVIASHFPESFCYTLSEAVLAGIPVVVTDIGALGPRVNEMGCGWVVPENADAKTFLKLLSRLAGEAEEYTQKCEAIRRLKLKSANEMAQDYAEIYLEKALVRTGKKNAELFAAGLLLVPQAKKAAVLAHEQLIARFIKEDVVRQHGAYTQALMSQRAQHDAFFGSNGYKAARKLRRLKNGR